MKPSSGQTRSAHWLRKHVYLFVLIGLALVWAQVIAQLLYPIDKALPFAKLAGESVQGQTQLELATRLQKQFEAENVTFSTNSTKAEEKLAHLGATADIDAAVKKVVDYPVWQRFIPFSILWLQPTSKNYTVRFEDKILAAASEKLAKQLSIPPVNADLEIKNGALVVSQAKEGQTVTKDEIIQRVKQQRYGLAPVHIKASSVVQVPAIGDEPIGAVRTQAEAIMNRKYTFRSSDAKEFSPDRTTVVSWLSLNKKAGLLKLGFNEAAIAKYFASIDGKVRVNPLLAQVALVDGREASRSGGKAGSTINTPDLRMKLTNAFNSNETGVVMDILMRPLTPGQVVSRRYTSSQAGLSAYVAYVTSTQNIRIAVQQVSGKGWTASGRASESIPSASTYKLYVALWLFDQMNKDKIEWTDPWLDTTVSGCFDRMTIASTNPCAEAWLRKVGRPQMNAFVYSRGFSGGTSFTNPTATHTTTADLIKFMKGLNSGSLIGGSQRDRLLSSLRIHPYRYGVPTGSAGRVEDKVGFLWDYIHDAAIVRHSKGTYVIVVMTKGYSYARIAQITRDIERIMYP